MSTPNETVSDEQITKLAAACQKAASRGFITHLKAAGVDDAKIEKLHAKYLEGTEKYAKKVEDMRTTILEGLAKAS